MGYSPEPQHDSYYYDNYTNCGWEGQNIRNLNDPYFAHQETSSFDHAVNTFMQDCSSMPQNDPHCDEFNNYSSCGWEDQSQTAFNIPYSTYQEPSSLKHTFNLFMQNCLPSPPSFSFENSSSLDYPSIQSFLQDPYNSFHQPQNSFHNLKNSFHTPQNNFTTTHPSSQNFSQPSSLELAEDLLQKSRELLERQEQSWKRQEILFKKMDGHLEQIRRNLELSNIEDEDQYVKKEVEEQDEEATVSSKISMNNEVMEVYEPRIPYSQRLIKVTMEHEDSLPKDVMKNQEEEKEEDNQGSLHSSEADNYIEEELIEPPIQEAFDEENTLTNTQLPSLEIKEVKATNKNTKKRIVTKISKTTFMKKKRSTANNPTPVPTGKANQASNRRKLAGKRQKHGILNDSSLPLRSFLLTN
ncbi:uncharacterized protein DS421_11g333410 [Arachis hypogaea]|nr:uncharacterized protein DS421_11g333410 [Arachis hypogaea]